MHNRDNLPRPAEVVATNGRHCSPANGPRTLDLRFNRILMQNRAYYSILEAHVRLEQP